MFYKNNSKEAIAYAKDFNKKKSQFVSHILNTNYSIKFKDPSFFDKAKVLASDYKTGFIFIGKNKDKAKFIKKLNEFLQEKQVLVKCFEALTNESYFIFLKTEPQEIYKELFNNGFFDKAEFEYLLKELDKDYEKTDSTPSL